MQSLGGMWVAVELLIIPVLLLCAIIILGILESFSVSAIALALVLLMVLYLSVRGLLRFMWRVEHDEGIESWEETPDEGEHLAHEGEPLAAEQASSPSPSPSSAALGLSMPQSVDMNLLERELLNNEVDDIVDECGDESFPASDPPSWTLGSTASEEQASLGDQT